ncbi:uncharacterized, partial [Tachysurus ichikawai]
MPSSAEVVSVGEERGPVAEEDRL